AGDVASLEEDLADPRRREADDGADERRLAHAVAPEDPDHLAGRHPQGDALEHVALAVVGVDVADFEHRRLAIRGQAIRMMPGSTGLTRSATSGSCPATTRLAAPASAWMVSKPASISGMLVTIWTGCRVSTLR